MQLIDLFGGGNSFSFKPSLDGFGSTFFKDYLAQHQVDHTSMPFRYVHAYYYIFREVNYTS